MRRDPQSTFLRVRRAAAVVTGAFVAAWIPAFALRWLDVGPVIGWPVFLAAIGIGGYAGYRQRLDPMEVQEQRDAVIGWSIVLAVLGVILAQLLPLPWNVIAALSWLVIVVLTGRALLSLLPRPTGRTAGLGDRPARWRRR